MSQENVELAREVLHALGTRDPDRLIALSDPEVEWHSFFAIGEGGGTYRGHDGTRRYMSDLNDAFEIARAEVNDALGVGDLALLVGRIHYRGKGSGVESEDNSAVDDRHVAWLVHQRDRQREAGVVDDVSRIDMLQNRRNKLVRGTLGYRDREPALEAIGLSE